MWSELDSLFGAHIAEVARRSAGVLERCGFDSLLVHAGEPLPVFRDDTEYPFKPHAMFRWWAPLLDAPGSIVCFQPGKPPRLFFWVATDFWYQAPKLPDAGWPEYFDVVTVSSASELQAAFPAGLGRTAWLGDHLPEHLQGRAECAPQDLWQRLEFARSQKTDYEIACLRAANELGARGHQAAAVAFHGGGSEYEIHQAFVAACGLREQELPYNAIVAVNESAAVLHYQILQRKRSESRSLLLDAGASCRGYGSDITRTHVREGHSEFAALVSALDDLQRRLANQVAPGVAWQDIHFAAVTGTAEILSRLQLVTCSAADAVESGIARIFFPHGIGHMLGLQVHDVAGTWADEQATPIPRPSLDPALRLTRKLEIGFVVTLEPGLYFIDSLLAPLKENSRLKTLLNWPLIDRLRPFGGVRIEDNLVLTASGHDNLTRKAFAAL